MGASGVSSAASGAPAAMPRLDRLDLGDLAGDRDLGVVLGARLDGALAADALALLLFAGAALGLALCARLGHRS